MSKILRNQEIAAIDKLSASVLEGIDTTFICTAMKGHVSDVFLNWITGARVKVTFLIFIAILVRLHKKVSLKL